MSLVATLCDHFLDLSSTNLNAMETLAQDLSGALPTDSDGFTEEFQNRLGEGVSKRALRNVYKAWNLHKCMSCPFHGEDDKELRKHLRATGHAYGVERLNGEKADFIKRLKTKVPIEGIEKFGDVHPHYAAFPEHLKREYEHLLYLCLMQITFRR